VERSGHAVPARLVLGRVVGIAEDKLQGMVWSSPPDTIIEAASKQ
jgi:hypothetical protein